MLLQTLAENVQATGLSQTLRASLWLYPMVNTGHVVGIALLFGAIVPLDLRLLGAWRGVPVEHLARPLVTVAACGMTLALLTGSLLFATRPEDYGALVRPEAVAARCGDRERAAAASLAPLAARRRDGTCRRRAVDRAVAVGDHCRSTHRIPVTTVTGEGAS